MELDDTREEEGKVERKFYGGLVRKVSQAEREGHDMLFIFFCKELLLQCMDSILYCAYMWNESKSEIIIFVGFFRNR